MWDLKKKKKSHGKWAVRHGVCGCVGRKMHIVFLVLIVGMNDKEIFQITTKRESPLPHAVSVMACEFNKKKKKSHYHLLGILICMKNDIVDGIQ